MHRHPDAESVIFWPLCTGTYNHSMVSHYNRLRRMAPGTEQ